MAYDFCIIGAGSGGLSVAAAAAQFGAKVVLIEKAEMGGDCLNYGCVPSKALIAASKAAYMHGHSEQFGVLNHTPRVDMGLVRDHVRSVIGAIEPHDSQERFESLGVRVIRSAGYFTSADTVHADGEDFKARYFVIATGSSPSAPPIAGLSESEYFTNETIFENDILPDHLIVIGGGPIGMELAQAHRRLGSRVTVLEAFTPLGKDDPELTGVVLDQIGADGIEVISGAKISSVSARHGDVRIDLSASDSGRSGMIEGSHLLVAAGRKANVDDLGLDSAGIRWSPRGIEVDSGLRTSNARIYAIGDVAGGFQFTHMANYHAGLVIRNALFGFPARVNTDIVPWVTYTDPELAHVGLSEEQARSRFGDKVKVLRWNFDENDRAQAERSTSGLIKAIVSPRGKVLGAGIVGKNAGDLILPWSLAVSSGLKIKSMIDMIVPYPTLGEVSKRAAIGYYSGLSKSRLIQFAMRCAKIFR